MYTKQSNFGATNYSMNLGYARYLKFMLYVVEWFLLNASFAAISYFTEPDHLRISSSFFSQFYIINLAYVLNFIFFERRERLFDYQPAHYIRSSVKWIIFLFIFIAFSSYFAEKTFPKLHNLKEKFALFGCLFVLWRFLFMTIIMNLRKNLRTFKKVMLLGNSRGMQQLNVFFQKHGETGYEVSTLIDNENELSELSGNNKAIVNRLQQIQKAQDLDEIFCCLKSFTNEDIQEIANFCDEHFIRLRIVPDYSSLLINKPIYTNRYGTVNVIEFYFESLEIMHNRVIKRVFDFMFSLFALIILSPLMFIIIPILIKLSSRGPVFFVQERSGKNNKPFNCFKYRTMRVNMDANKIQATKDDPRITKIGSILRKTSMDELPQFINVLLGSMSIVGPRPHMLYHTESYKHIANEFMMRHAIKPGITGWAQINGYRGEIKNERDIKNRVDYDLYYLENWSLYFDIKIIFLTVYYVIKGQKTAY